jgi:hypothetical protein
MPRLHKNKSHNIHASNGLFAPQSVPTDTDTGSDEDDSADTVAWESDSDFEPEADREEVAEWERLPHPMTYDEREEMRQKQKERAAEKRRVAEVRSAEQRLAGPIENQAGV